jgi:type IV pilus assembly protein PilO
MQSVDKMKQAMLEILRLRRRTLTLVLVLLLLNIGLFVFVAAYQTTAINNAQAKWSDLRRRVAVIGRNDVAAIYQGGKADLEKLKTHIPSKRQFPRLLGGIFDTASSDGVVVGNVSYRPAVVKDNANLLTYGISMSVSGNYAAVKSFLADMQKMEEMVVVDGMSMANNDPYEEKVVMDLRLTVYLQEEQ